MSKDSGKDGHANQGRKGSGEDKQTGVPHGHKGRDQEGLVANFGNDNHGERKDERMQRVCSWLFIQLQLGRGRAFRACIPIFRGCVFRGRDIVGFRRGTGFL